MVIVGTLVAQGLTLPWVIRRLSVEPPDPRLDALQRASAQERATEAAVARLDELVAEERVPAEVVERLRRLAELRTFIVWERLADRRRRHPAATYRRLRAEMIRAERDVLVRLRDAGELDDEVLRQVQQSLDLEDAMIAQADDATPDHEGMLEDLIPAGASTCEHLQAAAGSTSPLRRRRLRGVPGAGLDVGAPPPVPGVRAHRLLRLLEGPPRPAHYHDTAHPVMRSIEPGEAWRWCFVDRVLG